LDTQSASYKIFLEPYDPKRLANLCGYCGENLKLLETRLTVEIHSRGNYFEVVSINDMSRPLDACTLLENLYLDTLIDTDLSPNMVHLKIVEQLEQSITTVAIDESSLKPIRDTQAHQRNTMDKRNSGTTSSSNETDDLPVSDSFNTPSVKAMRNQDEISEIHTHRKVIRLRSNNQKLYAKNIANYDINFGVGPAGTGKTYLAVAAAVNAFKNDEVKRILLIRPAVEAGEKLGFLPGDLSEKVNPYLRPLYDALYEMLGFEQVAKLIDRQIIEVCPLAYMRGRTLSDAFIILDESQNTTPAQMKMLLTRIGFGSKAVITGDVTQIDLPKGQTSGLHDALRVLKGIENIGVTYFSSSDVVRHPIVKCIIEAYDESEKSS